jgi:hypothetical protein
MVLHRLSVWTEKIPYYTIQLRLQQFYFKELSMLPAILMPINI